MTDTFTTQDIREIIEDFAGASFENLLRDSALNDSTWNSGNRIAIRAAKAGHVSTLRYLASEGVDLGQVTYGSSPLSAAAAFGQDAVVEFLKDQRNIDISNANEPNPELVTPFSLVKYAENNGHPELARKIEVWASEARARRPQPAAVAGVVEASTLEG